MDFHLTDEQRLLKTTAREVAERELRPKAARWDREDTFPWENIPILREAGFLGISIPPAYGGGGGSLLDVVLVMEQVARVCPPSSFIVSCQTGLGAKAIALYGSEAQRETLLPKITRGETLIGWGMTEPAAGSDLGGIQTTARRCDGGYVLNGQKTFISLAHVAHLFLVITRIGDAPGLDGLGAFLVPRDTPGFSLGAKIQTLGIRGTGMGELFFDNCQVAADDLLIPPGGFREVLRIMSGERVAGNPPISLGIADAALEATVAYMHQRRQFGPSLADFQGLRWMLADMAIKLEAARVLVYRAAANAENGIPSAFEASVAKTMANEAGIEITNAALQIHGAYGYTTDLPIERMLRDARGMAIGDGTVQIQRNLIASHLLRQHSSARPA
jgi:butyryl-CoA dehydrogenase